MEYDFLLKINGDYFTASSVELVRVGVTGDPPSPVVNVYLTGGHLVAISDADEITIFREQYLLYLKKNGVRMFGDL